MCSQRILRMGVTSRVPPDWRMVWNLGRSGRKRGVKTGAKVFDKQARIRDVYGKGARRVCRSRGAWGLLTRR